MAKFSLDGDGRLGYFWPVSDGPPNLEEEPLRGWVRRNGKTLIDVLDEDAIART